MPTIRIGTSGWSYKDWTGSFYPPATRPGDYLSFYASRFDAVEVDSTFYAIPPTDRVANWARRTPAHFRFCLKMPKVITHEKVLVDCERDRDAFLRAIEPLGEKLHSILLQFGYFNKQAFARPADFLSRLDNFLQAFPDDIPVAVEIRNKWWLKPAFFDLLRAHRTAYVAADQAWMPPVEQVLANHDVITGDFVYVRLVGDRKKTEEITTTWEKTVLDRRADLERLVRALAGVIPRADVVLFVNNHYAGHAPASCEEFLDAMEKASIAVDRPTSKDPPDTLF
jgi:uncharacterized protein YecE (DUF72 family)